MKPNQLLILLAVPLVLLGYSEAGTESISKCPSTIFRKVSSSDGTVAVTWDQPDCGDNPHSTHTNGAEFPSGVHTVIFWFGADQSRRCCSFDIVVSGPDFDLCTQNQCFNNEICVPGLDHYYCYNGDIILHNCPSLVVIRKEENEMPVADWVEPTAYDYLGREIQPSSSTVSLGDTLTLGEHTYAIMYSYTTPAGNEVTDICSFRVIVAQEIGPGILSCPRDIRVVSSQPSVQVEWLEPQLQPNEDPSTIMTSQTHSPGQMFTVPSRVTVSYEYTLMGNGRTTMCTFNVETVSLLQERSVTLVQDKSRVNGKFFVIPSSIRDIADWPRPFLSVTGGIGPVMVFPSRVQRQGSGYAKGFYPVEYTFQDTEGNILKRDEFVVVYQSDSPDDITVTCISATTELFSETQLAATWQDPVSITGEDGDLAWIEESHSQPFDIAAGDSIDVVYMVYRTDNLQPEECRLNVAVIDTILPIVSNCPVSMQYSTFQGTPTDTTIHFPEPTAMDGCGEVTVASTPASGSPVTLSIGETVNVEYRFTDCSGNVALCQFSVSVAAINKPLVVLDDCKDQVFSTNDPFIIFPLERYPTVEYNNDQEIAVSVSPPVVLTHFTFIVTARFNLLDADVRCSFNVTVLDMIPPLVEDCDQTVTVRPVESGIRYMPVNWTEPRGVMNLSGGELVYQSHFPLQPLPVGETTLVEYTFKDEADLETTCTVRITVEEAPPVPPCPDPKTMSPCSGDNQEPKTAVFSFTNDIIITIVVTAVGTFVVCILGFLFCICCCTCCCAVEQKAVAPPVPRGAAHRATEDTGSRGPTAPGAQSRFVIKLPGIGKVPIYGQVEALSSTDVSSSQQTGEDTLDFDGSDANPDGRSGNRGYANEAFPSARSEPDDAPRRFVDTGNDSLVYGYDQTPQQVARPAPLPPLKPRLPPKPPTVPTNDFLQMEMEMKNIRDSRINGYGARQIDDSEIYGFDPPPS